MLLKKIHFYNFRNISNELYEPSPKFNILYGNNAQGKTNILEGIYVLSNFKSYKTNKNTELLKIGEKICKLKTAVIDTVENNIEYQIENNKKIIYLNNKKVNDASQIIDNIKSVIFSPEENIIFRGSPDLRRSLIDRAIFVIEPTYINTINNYKKCLKQRNILLKSNKSEQNIKVWNEILIKEGSKIRFKRHIFIKNILSDITKIYTNISNEEEEIDIKYKEGNDSINLIEAQSEEEIIRDKEKELYYKQTLSGPHRDDPLFLINGKNIRNYSSQGQLKTFILSFKISQLLHLKRSTGKTPILLLDEISSEIDNVRKEKLFNIVEKIDCQTFITTSDVESINKELRKKSKMTEILNGSILK